jgi:uncharacterized protein YecA (UPF0149 family)
MKGRNTTVISARIPDKLAIRLRQRVSDLGVTLSEYIELTLELVDRSQSGFEIRRQWDRVCLQPTTEIAHNSDEIPGKNDICPCGSGKKYRKCCGQLK